MKKINEVQVWSKEKLARDHRLAVIMMVQQQIDIVGELMGRQPFERLRDRRFALGGAAMQGDRFRLGLPFRPGPSGR